jgi:hypothetical protein
MISSGFSVATMSPLDGEGGSSGAALRLPGATPHVHLRLRCEHARCDGATKTCVICQE